MNQLPTPPRQTPDEMTPPQGSPGSSRRATSRRATVRWALAGVVGCLLLLALAPGAQAFGTATISGTVTEATGGKLPIQDVIVDVYEASGSELFELESTVTNAKGEYTVGDLSAGSYKVKFSLPFESKLNFAPEYFEDATTFASATPVVIAAEGEHENSISVELHEGATIFGRVSDGNGNPVKEAQISVFSAVGQTFEKNVVTNSNGEYTAVGLATGNYKLQISPPFGTNLVAQFYANEPTYTDATLIAAEAGKETKRDVTLQTGGEISGRVTDAVSHNPIAEAFVIATNASGFELGFGFAETNSNGEYTILGLASGSYNVEFFAEFGSGHEYITQTDSGVGVTQPNTTSGINAALIPNAPNNTGSPSVSGTPALGQMLSCSNGSWSGVTPIKYSVQWLRDGSSIGSASGSTYVVQSEDQGHALSCEVTATNTSGHSSAKSATVSVPSPPPPPPPPIAKVSFSPSTLVVFKGSTRVRITCSFAPCTGVVELIEQIITRHHKGNKTVVRKTTLILGKGAYALPAGGSGTFVITLNKLGKRKLAGARHHRLSVVLLGSVSGGKSAKATVQLSGAVRRK